MEDTQGSSIGTVKEVLQPGAQDVYVIATDKGRMMIPALKRVVLTVDVQKRLVVLDESVLAEVAVLDD